MLSDMFHSNFEPFSIHCFDCGLPRLPDQNYGLTAGVTGEHGMLTPPRDLITNLKFRSVELLHI